MRGQQAHDADSLAPFLPWYSCDAEGLSLAALWPCLAKVSLCGRVLARETCGRHHSKMQDDDKSTSNCLVSRGTLHRRKMSRLGLDL